MEEVEGVFVSGVTFRVVDPAAEASLPLSGRAATPGPSAAATAAAAADEGAESEYEAYTEPEEDDDEIDTTNPEVFEELFGYKRKAGAKGHEAARSHKKGAGRERARATRQEEPSESLMSVKALISAGLIRPYLENVTISVKRQNHVGSLTPDGDIAYEGKTFKTPNLFSQHVKKQQGHNRPGGNGWRSVLVDGTPLEEWWALLPPSAYPTPSGKETSRGAAAAGDQLNAASLRSRRGSQAAEAAGAELAGDAVAPGPANWVQCASCSQWRLVPAPYWPSIDATGDQDWYCKNAPWDVTKFDPHTEPCEQ